MAEALDRAGLMRRSRIPIVMALLLGVPLLGGCLFLRETRQLGVETVALDASTRRPIPGATLIVRADRGKGGPVEYRRYGAGEDGRFQVPVVQGWYVTAGLPLRKNLVSPWQNEITCLAPGHAWIRIPLGERLRGRAPDSVVMDPLPEDAPRVGFARAERRTWSGLETWEMAVSACEGRAQGLREGDGSVIYWDPQRVIIAASVDVSEAGMSFEASPRTDRVLVIENGGTLRKSRAFLDARSCKLDLRD